jgi:hypothetical protein
MSKVKDLSVIQQAVADMIDEKCPDLVENIGRDNAIWCVMAIYTTNDLCSGYGQDFVPDAYRMMILGHKKVSVISFQNGVSVIIDSASSRYQDRFAMCGYTDLNEDLTQICICIQAAIDRINS